MKNTIALLLASFLFVTCKKDHCTNGFIDGNETGLNCGGDCPAACVEEPNPNAYPWGTNETFYKLLKTWYKHTYSNNINATIGGGLSQNTNIYLNPNCTVTFTDTPWPNYSPNWTAYGIVGGCFPAPTPFLFDPSTNMLWQAYVVSHVDSSWLHLIKSGGKSYDYYSSPPDLINSELISWEVELSESYVSLGELQIEIFIGGVITDSIPIVPGQLLYSNDKIIDLSAGNNNIRINLTRVNDVVPFNNNQVFFTKKLIRNGEVLAKSGPSSFCVGNSCSGFDDIEDGMHPDCVVFWWF